MSKNRKTLQELTIKDNFMFAAVMSDPENCRQVLEMLLGISIDWVGVDTEKSIVYHPEYHGIRLDVLAKDESHTRYSIEMQVAGTPIEKRSRYYHSQIDTDLLLAGAPYEQLPETWVIFICDYDPFGDHKYCYTVESRLKESGRLYGDGSHTMFLSTCGNNPEEVAPELVRFLQYVKADLEESTKDFEDELVRRLQRSVQQIKISREMEARYMVLEEMLRQERREGYEEGVKWGQQQGIQMQRESILDILSDLGEPSQEFLRILEAQKDPRILKEIFCMVRKAVSLEQLETELAARYKN